MCPYSETTFICRLAPMCQRPTDEPKQRHVLNLCMYLKCREEDTNEFANPADCIKFRKRSEQQVRSEQLCWHCQQQYPHLPIRVPATAADLELTQLLTEDSYRPDDTEDDDFDDVDDDGTSLTSSAVRGCPSMTGAIVTEQGNSQPTSTIVPPVAGIQELSRPFPAPSTLAPSSVTGASSTMSQTTQGTNVPENYRYALNTFNPSSNVQSTAQSDTYQQAFHPYAGDFNPETGSTNPLEILQAALEVDMRDEAEAMARPGQSQWNIFDEVLREAETANDDEGNDDNQTNTSILPNANILPQQYYHHHHHLPMPPPPTTTPQYPPDPPAFAAAAATRQYPTIPTLQGLAKAQAESQRMNPRKRPVSSSGEADPSVTRRHR